MIRHYYVALNAKGEYLWIDTVEHGISTIVGFNEDIDSAMKFDSIKEFQEEDEAIKRESDDVVGYDDYKPVKLELIEMKFEVIDCLKLI